MALADIYQRTRSLIYGQGLGEQPPIRVAASNADESVSGDLVTFSLASGEGDKCKPGQVLSVYDADAEADAHAVYITSISTDTITGVNGYNGSPTITGSDSGDVDSKAFEQNPLVLGYEIFEAIDTIIARYLWPDVYTIETKTISSPDLVYGQEAVAADVKEIISAWQVIGTEVIPIPFMRTPLDVDTSIKSTGQMAEFGWYDGSTGYYTVKTKIAEADEVSDELTRLIATGAAAVALGSTLAETSLSRTKKDNVEAVNARQPAANSLWRDFLTLKQNYSQELGRELPQQIIINRG